MNYEKFKRSDRLDRFRSLTTVDNSSVLVENGLLRAQHSTTIGKTRKITSASAQRVELLNLLQNVHVRISFYRNRKAFCVNP
jgi:hypothetical protein